jgi:hypothetical protein
MITDLFIKGGWCEPEILLSGKIMGRYMTNYAGQKYRDQPPTYFTQTCKSAMMLRYKDKPTTFSYPKINHFSDDETWEVETGKGKDRYIAFPIWKFLTPEEVIAEFGKERADALSAKLRKEMYDLDKDARAFADEIDLRLCKPKAKQAELDF